MGSGIEKRLRSVPALYRVTLVVQIHQVIDDFEAEIKRLPPELSGASVADHDPRLSGWDMPRKKRGRKVGTQ